MKIALFGGTGFVGSYIIDELISQDFTPRVLVRKNSESKVLNIDNCEIVNGDINDNPAIMDTIKGCDAVIYNIGIIRQFPKKGITFENLHFQGAKRCIDEAKKLGIKRFVLMSANGVCHDGTDYQATKMLAEEYLKWVDLDYTIFRNADDLVKKMSGKNPQIITGGGFNWNDDQQTPTSGYTAAG